VQYEDTIKTLECEIERYIRLLERSIRPSQYGWLREIIRPIPDLEWRNNVISIRNIMEELDKNNPNIIFGG